MKREQEVGVPPGVLVVRRPAAPPPRQSGVQEVGGALGAGRTQLRLVLELIGQKNSFNYFSFLKT